MYIPYGISTYSNPYIPQIQQNSSKFHHINSSILPACPFQTPQIHPVPGAPKPQVATAAVTAIPALVVADPEGVTPGLLAKSHMVNNGEW